MIFLSVSLSIFTPVLLISGLHNYVRVHQLVNSTNDRIASLKTESFISNCVTEIGVRERDNRKYESVFDLFHLQDLCLSDLVRALQWQSNPGKLKSKMMFKERNLVLGLY